jgi:hypothetical protein
MKRYKIGQKVIYLKEVPDEDWQNIGKVVITFKKEQVLTIKDIAQHHPDKNILSLYIKGLWYPSTMFEESINESFYAI